MVETSSLVVWSVNGKAVAAISGIDRNARSPLRKVLCKQRPAIGSQNPLI
ncbi:MAG: hypothetical protein ACM37W_23835 [Actinomycetota bacterium]